MIEIYNLMNLAFKSDIFWVWQYYMVIYIFHKNIFLKGIEFLLIKKTINNTYL